MFKAKLKTQDVVLLYVQDHLTLRQIAAKLSVSHSAVSKHLIKAGVTASAGEHVRVECGFCGKVFEILRCRWRKTKRRSFCSSNCYLASRENPGFKPWRHGSRIARAIVAQYFHLEPQHIVDHRDGDERNNDRANLRVYANQSDHMKMHHGGKIDVLWDGATVQ